MSSDSPVVVITGGSRGIGAATAILAAGRGYRVVITYRQNQQAADGVIGAIERAGAEGLAVRADVGDEADVVRVFEAVDARFGRIDALVNNAGILHLQMPVVEMS